METKPKRFPFPWLFRWKFWRNVLLLLAGLVTVYALFCAEENLRGRYAWESYKREMEAKGEVFDFRKFVPPPVSDGQNFAATPFFAQLFDFIPGTQKLRDSNTWDRVDKVYDVLPNKAREELDSVSWQPTKPLDLVELANELLITNHHKLEPPPVRPGQTNVAVQTIMNKLQPAMATIEELRKASKRPYSRFNIAYDTKLKFSILLPHLAGIKSVCMMLELRSCAELRSGDVNAAFEDVKLIFHLVQSTQTEPFLISQVVRASCLSAMLQPVWEGLEQRKWSDEQLEELIKELHQLDFTGDGMRCLQAEESFCDTIFAQLRRNWNPMKGIYEIWGNVSDFSTPDFPADFFTALAPSGWFYLEQLNYHKFYYNQTVGVISSNRVDPDSDVANQRKIERLGGISFGQAFLKHEEMAQLLLPALNTFMFKIARAQTGANLAVIACALERYRLKHGNFPENLTALSPEYLRSVPNDLIMDQPLKYHLTTSGSFVLYSIGWNNKDDGGVPAKNVHPRAFNDMTDGDWVWEYPAALSSK